MRTPDQFTHYEDQRDAALELLDPPADQWAKWRSEVDSVLDMLEYTVADQDTVMSERSKAFAKAWGTYELGLLRLQNAGRKLQEIGWEPPIDPQVIKQALDWHKPVRKQKRFVTEAQKEAVAYAYQLLQRRGLEIKTTRGGLWWRLAAILFGNPRADLFQYMRRYFRDADRPPHI